MVTTATIVVNNIGRYNRWWKGWGYEAAGLPDFSLVLFSWQSISPTCHPSFTIGGGYLPGPTSNHICCCAGILLHSLKHFSLNVWMILNQSASDYRPASSSHGSHVGNKWSLVTIGVCQVLGNLIVKEYKGHCKQLCLGMIQQIPFRVLQL